METTRIESAVTSISWIPRQAIEGLTRLPFDMGATRYDLPPPDILSGPGALDSLKANDGFRFANELRGWIEVRDGRVTGHGRSGRGHMNVSKVRAGPFGVVFRPVPLPDLRPAPVTASDGTSVRFLQTAGGRTGMPAPRRIRGPAGFRVSAPIAWTTLALTIHADGRSEFELAGASPFPRHWLYGPDGRLAAKSGLIRFDDWYREAIIDNTPWGDREGEVIVTAVETELERELSRLIVDSRPEWRRLAEGEVLCEQGEPGRELYLLFDGVLRVEQDGETVAEFGPGAIVGEMALLPGSDGRRTATLRAATACRVGVVPGDRVAPEFLAEVADGRAEGRWEAGRRVR